MEPNTIKNPGQKIRRAVLIVTAGSVLYFGFNWCRDFWEIDVCLDSGGCYDYTNHVCRNEEPNAQELCDKSISK